MNLFRRSLSSLHNLFASRSADTPEERLRVMNVTRQTLLASNMEIADSGPKRSKGLLGRTGLGPGEGLWIVPCESVHTIGMQFPIDLVYLDRKQRVKKVRSNVPGWRLSACLSAHSVIELAAGVVQDTHTAPGDYLEFSPATTPAEEERRAERR